MNAGYSTTFVCRRHQTSPDTLARGSGQTLFSHAAARSQQFAMH